MGFVGAVGDLALMQAGALLALMSPSSIGSIQLRNRFIRSATSETLAGNDGAVADAYREFHVTLARGGVGLIITGHCYVLEAGKYSDRQTGIHTDSMVRGLASVTDAVHRAGAPIFAQLNHAGSQSRVSTAERIAPSPIVNPQTGRLPREASELQIKEVIEAFGSAGRRARDAGFDGVHIHAGHGYLLSEFLSPYTNRRDDRWGGSLGNRQRILVETIRAVRSAVGVDYPVTVKLGIKDFVDGGLALKDGVATAERIDSLGVAAVEVSAGLTTPRIESVVQYAGLTRRRALEDKLFHRVIAQPREQGYFLREIRAVKRAVRCPVIAVGGLRSVEFMESIVARADADFVSLARPFIREPDLVNQIAQGRRGLVDCTSCNICQQHDGVHSLRCWRKTNARLAMHALYKLMNHTNHT